MVSFQSQLNLYGFKRITTGKDANAYYHELFLRGREDLLPRLKPHSKSMPSSGSEPDFYKMEPSLSHQEQAQSLSQTIQKVQLIAQSESERGSPVPALPGARCGPLCVPGRLLYQSTETPTSLRFVKTPSFQNQRRQVEAKRWVRPLQLQHISTEWVHHSWQDSRIGL